MSGLLLTNLFCAGLLAGEEVAVCLGLRGPLAGLDQHAHITMRQALIRTLRVIVPILLAMTVATGAAVTVQGGDAWAAACRTGAMAALAAFVAVTLAGTVPINQAVLQWHPARPPADWRRTIARWERLDVARMWLGLAAFALFLAALK